MPTLAEIIRAEKTGVELGKWQTGKMPATAFPIAKVKRFPMGSAWHWRLVQFTALAFPCRVLIRLNIEKAHYTSVLAIHDRDAFRVLCHHDFHLGDKNWPCHFATGDVRDTFPGVLRDTERYRVFEDSPSKAEAMEFSVTQANALARAARRYRFQAQGGLL